MSEFYSIFQLGHKVEHFLEQKIKLSEPQTLPFSILGLLVYIVYFLGFSYLHVVAVSPFFHAEVGIICVLLLLKDFWPSRLKIFLPWFWFLSIFYLIPILMTRFFFQHLDSTSWIMAELGSVLLLALVLDWVMYLILLGLGFLVNFVIYHEVIMENLIHNGGLLISFIFILMALLLLRSRNLTERDYFRAMNLVNAVMAHELRTPLFSMRAGILGVKKYLPILVRGYKQALKQDDRLESIREDRLETLEKSGDEMMVSLNYSNVVIDALVAGFNNTSISLEFVPLDISRVIMSSIEQYPFVDNEINQVELIKSPNLKIMGNEAVFVHIFHNLFKYALYKIKEAEQGNIKIQVERKGAKGYIYFNCTGLGLPLHERNHVFDIIFSDKERLAKISTCMYLCKAAVKKMNGHIGCESYNNSTTFILTFRLADNV